MEEKINKQSINRLNISDMSMSNLKNKNINTIGQICGKTKTELKNIGLLQNEVDKIEIELELLGLRLKNIL